MYQRAGGGFVAFTRHVGRGGKMPPCRVGFYLRLRIAAGEEDLTDGFVLRLVVAAQQPPRGGPDQPDGVDDDEYGVICIKLEDMSETVVTFALN